MRSRLLVTALLTVALAVVMGAGCGKEKKQRSRIEQGQAAAQASFDRFLDRFNQPQPGDEGFSVLIKLTGGGLEEYCWIGELKLDEEPYSGAIASNPAFIGKQHGEPCTFMRQDIFDWMYMTPGIGGFDATVGSEQGPK